jgi:voltage-gated potassium channel
MAETTADPAALSAGGLRARYNAFIERHEIAWELTMAALAVAFVAIGFALDDAPESMIAPLLGLDVSLTVIFVAEFATRLAAAPSRAGYLRGHWIDAVALVPTARGVRVLRLARLLRLVRAFAGLYRALDEVERLVAHRGLLRLFITWMGVAVISSGVLYVAESNALESRIRQPFDALWWAVVTLTTVGYGDMTPVTTAGRIAAMLLIILGITLWAAITGTIISYILSSAPQREPDEPADTLLKLGRARAEGLLTEAEFEAKKSELLARI